jgi:PqqD family protein of HPr-rel-A system
VRHFVRAPGVLIEDVDGAYAAFSALSGETHLLNEECVAVIELLDEDHALDAGTLCRLLSGQAGVPIAEIDQAVEGAWERLIEGGLIRSVQ